MNIKHTFLAATIIVSQFTVTNDIQTTNSKPHLKEWCISYAAPCITGGIIGFLTGKSSAYAVNQIVDLTFATNTSTSSKSISVIAKLASIIAIFSVLTIENKIRTECTDSLNKSFEDYGITHNNLTNKSAQLISWYEFLRLTNMTKGILLNFLSPKGLKKDYNPF